MAESGEKKKCNFCGVEYARQAQVIKHSKKCDKWKHVLCKTPNCQMQWDSTKPTLPKYCGHVAFRGIISSYDLEKHVESTLTVMF